MLHPTSLSPAVARPRALRLERLESRLLMSASPLQAPVLQETEESVAAVDTLAPPLSSPPPEFQAPPADSPPSLITRRPDARSTPAWWNAQVVATRHPTAEPQGAIAAGAPLQQPLPFERVGPEPARLEITPDEDLFKTYAESRQAAPVLLTGDVDGDGENELLSFQDGLWWVDQNRNGVRDDGDHWGTLGGAGSYPLVDDFDGDGRDELAVRTRDGGLLIADAEGAAAAPTGSAVARLPVANWRWSELSPAAQLALAQRDLHQLPRDAARMAHGRADVDVQRR